MQDFRCSSCNKLLARIEGKAEIVCPRCKLINSMVTEYGPQAAAVLEKAILDGSPDPSKKPIGLLPSYSKGETLDVHVKKT